MAVVFMRLTYVRINRRVSLKSSLKHYNSPGTLHKKKFCGWFFPNIFLRSGSHRGCTFFWYEQASVFSTCILFSIPGNQNYSYGLLLLVRLIFLKEDCLLKFLGELLYDTTLRS